MSLGIKIGNRLISILLYTDDVVLLAPRKIDLQRLFDKMSNWCMNWRLNVNKSKSQVVYFRGSRIIQSNFKFKYGNSVLDTVSDYKYLGVILDEHLTLNECSKALSETGGVEPSE